MKTLQSISDANVVILLLDAHQDFSDQDAHIAGFVVEQGRALVVGVNKWDGLDDHARERAKHDLQRKLKFLEFAKFHFISATEKFGIGALMRSVDNAYAAAMAKLPTPRLTRALIDAVQFQQPRRRGPVRPKPVITSSTSIRMPSRVQASRSALSQPTGGTITPPEPWIGSQQKAATLSAPSSATFASSAATVEAITAASSWPCGWR